MKMRFSISCILSLEKFFAELNMCRGASSDTNISVKGPLDSWNVATDRDIVFRKFLSSCRRTKGL
jgi:hypothetical protein